MKAANTSTQQRKPTEIRQSEIVDAAIRIIASEGPRNFTAKRVADEVGITAGAVFRHFESMAIIVDRAADRIGTILAGDFPAGINDPIDRLHRFFLNRTRTIATHPHVSRLLLSDHLAQAAGSKSGDRLGVFKKRSRAFVVECLRDAEHAGHLGPGVKPEACAIVVLGAILALSHTGTRAVRTADIERLSEETWVALTGLFRKRRPRTLRRKD